MTAPFGWPYPERVAHAAAIARALHAMEAGNMVASARLMRGVPGHTWHVVLHARAFHGDPISVVMTHSPKTEVSRVTFPYDLWQAYRRLRQAAA